MVLGVFLVTDRNIVKIGIRAMLGNKPYIKLTGDATNEAEAIEKLRSSPCDVVLMDINFSDKKGLQFVNVIKKKYPKIKVLVLTFHESESTLIDLLNAGADGYLHNNISQEGLLQALDKLEERTMNNGSNYISPGKSKSKNKVTDTIISDISEKEMQVLYLIAEGCTNIDIAKKLFTSVRTIETRKKKLLEKTGTLNTATLIRFAVVNGLIN